MANIQIPNLPAAVALSGNELLEVVQSGTSVKASARQIANTATNYGPPTIYNGSFSIQDSDSWVIINPSANITVTMPSAANFVGRIVTFKNITNYSAKAQSAVVVPMSGTTATDVIFPTGCAGGFTTVVSDGSNWIKMQENLNQTTGVLLWE